MASARSLSLLLVVFFAACARTPPARTVAQRTTALERVVIVSVDGLRSADSVLLPTLGGLAVQGACAYPPEGALSVLPSVTYPAHTSIVTGVYPARHGVFTNHRPRFLGGKQKPDEWRWYRREIRVPTLYDAALEAGLRTALLQWPVTVGARASAHVPTFNRATTVEEAEQTSTRGLLGEIKRRFPKVSPARSQKMSDADVIDAALTVLATTAPNLMLLHLAGTDHAQHKFGPDAPEAAAARAEADTQVARLLSALRATREWPRTALVVVSDHGFTPLAQQVSPWLHLAAAGLDSHVRMNPAGGFAYFYLTDPGDHRGASAVRSLFQTLAATPGSGFARVLDRDTIISQGGDGRAFLGVEFTEGFAFGGARSGPASYPSEDLGTHGYLPERAAMRSTLLFYGPRIVPAHLTGSRLVDIAPTVAGWLGLALPDVDGRPLPITLR